MFLLQDTQLILQVCLRLLQSLDRVAQACVLFLGAVGRMQVQIPERLHHRSAKRAFLLFKGEV